MIHFIIIQNNIISIHFYYAIITFVILVLLYSGCMYISVRLKSNILLLISYHNTIIHIS